MLETAELRAKAYQEYLSSKAAKYAVASERLKEAPGRLREKEPKLKDEELEGLDPRQTLSTIQGHLEEVRNFKERVEAVDRKVLITSELFDQRAGKQLPDVLGLTEVFVGIIERAKPLGEKAKELVQKAEIAYTLALNAEMEATPPLPAALNPVRVSHLQKKNSDRIALLKSIYGDEWQDHLIGRKKGTDQLLQQRFEERINRDFELVPAAGTSTGFAYRLKDEALEKGIEVRVEEDEEGEGEKEIIGELFNSEEFTVVAAMLVAIKKKDRKFTRVDLKRRDVKELFASSILREKLEKRGKRDLRRYCEDQRVRALDRLIKLVGSDELKEGMEQEDSLVRKRILGIFVNKDQQTSELLLVLIGGDFNFFWPPDSDTLQAIYKSKEPINEPAPSEAAPLKLTYPTQLQLRDGDLETKLDKLFDFVESKLKLPVIKGQNVTQQFPKLKKKITTTMVKDGYVIRKDTNDHHDGFDAADIVKMLYIYENSKSLGGFNSNLSKDLNKAVKKVIEKRAEAKATAEENGEDPLSASESTYFAK